MDTTDLTSTDQPEEAQGLKESQAALENLREALKAAGIVLPSLGIDIGPTFGRTVLVELGRCTPETVRNLADVIRRGTPTPTPDPRRAAYLGGFAGFLRGHGYTVHVVNDRLRAMDGPDSRGVEVECRERPDDENRLWFTWAGGIWICEADKPNDALVAVKAALRRVDA